LLSLFRQNLPNRHDRHDPQNFCKVARAPQPINASAAAERGIQIIFEIPGFAMTFPGGSQKPGPAMRSAGLFFCASLPKPEFPPEIGDAGRKTRKQPDW
jgi:hypothetical protein